MHGTYYNATIAAYVTLYLRLGKDEVGSSNLPSSSKKHRKLRFSMLFCCKNAGNGVGQNVGQLPDPHRDPHNELNCTQENGHEILTHGPVRRTRI